MVGLDRLNSLVTAIIGLQDEAFSNMNAQFSGKRSELIQLGLRLCLFYP